MHTKILRPQFLSPEELDRYLGQGWYRIAQTLMTCRFVVYEGVLRSAVWTRVHLPDYRFKKSLRRILSKNDKAFRTTVAPATIDRQRQDLYNRYAEFARGDRPETLEQFLHGEEGQSVFHTQEISVWDGERLIAFALFDLGDDSLQSLIGVYDPDYESHSLGLYTLLCEVRHGQELGYTWHYAGYVLPGEAAMSYKLRLGHLEVYDWRSQVWHSIDGLDKDALPTEVLTRALDVMAEQLLLEGVASEVRVYPAYELNAYDKALAYCLSEPMFIECFPGRSREEAMVVTWDIDGGRYKLLRCLRAVGRSSEAKETGTEMALLIVFDKLAEDTDPARLARVVSGYLKR